MKTITISDEEYELFLRAKRNRARRAAGAKKTAAQRSPNEYREAAMRAWEKRRKAQNPQPKNEVST